MGKKKPLFGVSNYKKQKPRKRPGRHKKSPNSMRKEWVNIGVDKLDIISYIDSVPGYEPYNNCP